MIESTWFHTASPHWSQEELWFTHSSVISVFFYWRNNRKLSIIFHVISIEVRTCSSLSRHDKCAFPLCGIHNAATIHASANFIIAEYTNLALSNIISQFNTNYMNKLEYRSCLHFVFLFFLLRKSWTQLQDKFLLINTLVPYFWRWIF